jgi:eukaryotic-like serine/threonine-protein kinase
MNRHLFRLFFTGKFPDRSAYQLHIPQKIRNYIRKAIEPDPKLRYNSILDFLNDLAGVAVDYNWHLTETENGFLWQCLKGVKKYNIMIDFISKTEASIKTTKTVYTGASARQINDYSNKKLNFKDAYKLAKHALHNNSL